MIPVPEVLANISSLKVGHIPYASSKASCRNPLEPWSCAYPGLVAEMSILMANLLNKTVIFVPVTDQIYDNAVMDLLNRKFDVTAPTFIPNAQRLESVDTIPWYQVFKLEVWFIVLGLLVLKPVIAATRYRRPKFAKIGLGGFASYSLHLCRLVFRLKLLSKLMVRYTLPFTNTEEAKSVFSRDKNYTLVTFTGSHWAYIASLHFANTVKMVAGPTDFYQLPNFLLTSKTFALLSNLGATHLERANHYNIIRSPQDLTEFPAFFSGLLLYRSPWKRPLTRALNWLMATGCIEIIRRRYAYEYRTPSVFWTVENSPLTLNHTASIFAVLSALIGIFVIRFAFS